MTQLIRMHTRSHTIEIDDSPRSILGHIKFSHMLDHTHEVIDDDAPNFCEDKFERIIDVTQ